MRGTPRSDRLRIVLVGRRNAGKSSLINALTGQRAAIVSAVAGTTTDPVYKAMELPPLGPVTFVDTAGLDDEGSLGGLRSARSWRALDAADIVLMVLDAGTTPARWEEDLAARINARDLPLLVAWNKTDLLPERSAPPDLPGSPLVLPVSTLTGEGVEALRRALTAAAPPDWAGPPIVADLLEAGDTVLLVTPQDIEAPRGRLILPQVQTLREILDAGATACVAKEDGLERMLGNLRQPPRLVITDSQVFWAVDRLIPAGVPLTSFSILFARHRGDIAQLVEGMGAVDRLRPGDEVLVAEACTHHPIGDDIGRRQIPRQLEARAKGELNFTWVQGGDFPEDLRRFRLAVHCGGCMISRREMLDRLARLERAGVPAVNYGVLLAGLLGILDRALGPFPGIRQPAKEGAPPCRIARS